MERGGGPARGRAWAQKGPDGQSRSRLAQDVQGGTSLPVPGLTRGDHSSHTQPDTASGICSVP